MPKKASETQDDTIDTPVVVDSPKILFTFPSIGFSCMASSLEDAQAEAAKIANS